MNASEDGETSRNLEKVLKKWVVDTPLPPRFQEQVWHRIARNEAEVAPVNTVWPLLRNFIAASLSRPRFAYAYVIVLLLLGIASGTWAAQREGSRLNAALGSAYVQSVDPYQKSSGRP